MLTKIALNNFKSFRSRVTIDLAKTDYTSLPQNVADNSILKGCIFVGANFSGKSTILLAIRLLLDLLFLERGINLSAYLCTFSSSLSYSLTYEFLIDRKVIRYSFEVDTGKSILCEKLYLDGKLMLNRTGMSATSFIADEHGISYDERDIGRDTLFLRTLYFNTKFSSSPVLMSWMVFLENSVYINLFHRQVISYGSSDVSLAGFLESGGCLLINDFFEEHHFEQSIEYNKHSGDGKHMIFLFDPDEKESYIFIKREGFHVPIPFGQESVGNQNLLRVLPTFLTVTANGGMLLADSFSCGFHNELEHLLVRFFMEKSINAQLLFESHSTNLLCSSLLRPDQEYAVEFHGEKGSCVRRFSSEHPRPAQNIEKMYVSGVFGGLPDYKED